MRKNPVLSTVGRERGIYVGRKEGRGGGRREGWKDKGREERGGKRERE